MFGDDVRAAGRSCESMQHKEPKVRVSKTYQDSNIFGYKDSTSSTVTENVRREMQRSNTAGRRVLAKPTQINEVFANEDRNARHKLKKSNDPSFEPKYEKMSPSKRHVYEFYGEHHTDAYEGSLMKPQSALSKSMVTSPKTANQAKWTEMQSNIFSDKEKVLQDAPAPENNNKEKLLSSLSTWNSKDTFKKSCNIRRSVDLSSVNRTAFAQSKKKMEMESDIFGQNPFSKRREDKSPIDARPQEIAKAKFGDTKNEEVRRTQHLFSDLFSHEDKNYTYNKNNVDNAEPVRPANLAWNDSRIEKMSPRKSEDQKPNERKMAHLSSSAQSTMAVEYKSPTNQPAVKQVVSDKALEREMMRNMSPLQKKGLELRSEVPIGNNTQSWPASKPGNDASVVYDFDLKSIPQNMDMDTLKKTFAGYHVIDIKADHNSVNGSALGTGRVQLRSSTSHDILKLKHFLKDQGITMESHTENHNKKRNYQNLAKISWTDQYLQKEEGRLKSEFNSAFESKLKNLQSEGDVFGNSQGVGKWDMNAIEMPPNSKTDTGGEQKSAVDIVKTLNWKNSIKNVPNTMKRSMTPTDTLKRRPSSGAVKTNTTPAKKVK